MFYIVYLISSLEYKQSVVLSCNSECKKWVQIIANVFFFFSHFMTPFVLDIFSIFKIQLKLSLFIRVMFSEWISRKYSFGELGESNNKTRWMKIKMIWSEFLSTYTKTCYLHVYPNIDISTKSEIKFFTKKYCCFSILIYFENKEQDLVFFKIRHIFSLIRSKSFYGKTFTFKYNRETKKLQITNINSVSNFQINQLI